MPNRHLTFAERSAAIWQNILQMDNHLIGLVICVFAVYSWLGFYDGVGDTRVYFPQGIYTLPSLSVLNTFFSAVYLTFAAIILLSLRQPLSRYNTALPNLTAILAAFTVYVFVFVPAGELMRFNTAIALALIIAGSLIIITSLIYLRQAFSVTPQARFLVTSGPYSYLRHPMYAGNILSILGLALLIDSVEAVILFFVCSALQIRRALYEEQLLQNNLSGYRDYAKRVGRFFPRLRSRQLSAAAVLALVGLTAMDCATAPPASAQVSPFRELLRAPAPETSTFGDRAMFLRVAVPSGDWDKKCDTMSKKAIAGNWFNKVDQADFNKTETNAEELGNRFPACKAFFALQSTCEEITRSWQLGETKDSAFMDQVDAKPGCAAVAGFDNVCGALKNIARKGIRLSDARRSVMAECAVSDIRKQRVELLRPAM